MGTGASELTSECGWKQGEVAIANEARIIRENQSPFPVPPKGNAGAGGFPPRRRKNRRLPPQEGPPPCALPRPDV
jgi:hypothetical protein